MCYNSREVKRMTTVYDIIEELRKAKNLSIRKLADAAGIAPSTLESILTKRSQGISVLRLRQIASAFGLEWTDLFETGREYQVTMGDKAKVNSYIKEEEQQGILYRAFQKANLDAVIQPYETPEILSLDESYIKLLNATIKELNTEGLKEAMFNLMSLAREPKYRKEYKENTGV